MYEELIQRIVSMTGNPGELRIIHELVAEYGPQIVDLIEQQNAIGDGKLWCLYSDLNHGDISKTAEDIMSGNVKNKLTDQVLRRLGYLD